MQSTRGSFAVLVLALLFLPTRVWAAEARMTDPAATSPGAGDRDASGSDAASAVAALDDTDVAGDADTDPTLAKLANMSLEDLMQTRVTTVTGAPGARIAAPAAVTVITADDIRRNGFHSVIEALRLVPDMFVGRVNSGAWVGGARGLSGSSLTANRFLVLIDGRLVYDPLISVAFWDVVDVPLADLDRIEVVRGPGSTLWGVNAMNGVISIITKRASDTLGTRVEVGAGSNDARGMMLRHGATVGDNGAYRVWLKYDGHGDFENAAGDSLHDDWSSLRGGFRLDGTMAGDATYTLQGDAYTHPTAMESVRLPVPGQDRQFEQHTQDDTINGGNLLFRALSGYGADDGWMLRAYVDHTRRDTSRFGVRRDTADVEYRRWLKWNPDNDLMFGIQADRTRDRVDNGPVLIIDPSDRAWNTFNAFVQNTTTLVDDRLFLMLGTKLTHHDFVGFQTQPSMRLWWTPSERQTLWASVSRPIRVPSRFEENGLLVFSYVDQGLVTTGTPNGVIVPLGLAGDPDLRPEKLLAWEVGHRIQATDRWAFDTALFYNHYQRLVGVPSTIIGRFNNDASGATWGGSLSVTGQLSDRWRVEGSYSRLQTRIDGPVLQFDETDAPREQGQLHAYFDLSDALEFDAAVYRVSKVPFLGVEAYTRADLGVHWRPRPGTEISLWGQNLLDANHVEASGAQIPRTVYAQVSFDLAH